MIRIACQSPESLGGRISKAPLRVVRDPEELRAGGYQEEGAIVPDLVESEPLSRAELARLAIDLDAPDALRLVLVPQATGEFMQALGRSGLLFASELGVIRHSGKMSFAQAPPDTVNTSIDPTTGRRVGLHIDAMVSGADRYRMLMGVACGEGGRGLTFCPDITTDAVSQDLCYAQSPEDRLARREQIRRAAERLRNSVICYTVWLEGRSAGAETYEAYANFQPHNMLHDGTSYHSDVPAAVQLLSTPVIGPDSFESIV